VRYLAGGINLVDFIRYQIEQTQALVDFTRLPLAAIEELPGGGLHLGALVSNATAYDAHVQAPTSTRQPPLPLPALGGEADVRRTQNTTLCLDIILILYLLSLSAVSGYTGVDKWVAYLLFVL
jgi:xanthine dehydrogenase YagS FAD-binding subunit